MKNYIKFVAVGLLWLFLVAWNTGAQTNVITPSTRDWSGRVVLPDSDQPTSVDSINTLSQLQRPTRLEQNKLPPEVQERLRIFEQVRKRYLEQQEILRRRLLGATDQDRARIRAQIQTLREHWLERARQLRQEFKDRQRELLDKLPGHREVLENAREAARDQVRDQMRDTRDRRGQD